MSKATARKVQAKGASSAPSDQFKNFLNLNAAFTPSGLAYELAAAADALSDALESGNVCEPLDRNLQVWVAIKTLANNPHNSLSPELRQDLTDLADRITATTFAMAKEFSSDSILHLIEASVNLSKTLSDAVIEQLVRERAYALWQEAGADHGRDQEFWFTAQREIAEAMAQSAAS